MSKDITLPLNYSTSDNDVGTLTQDTGRDYVRSDVNIDSIKSALSVSVNDFDSLFNHASINKWAAFKPSNGGNAGDHGLLISGLGNQITYPTRTRFQLLDWGGYNHAASPPELNTTTDSVDYLPGNTVYPTFRYNLGEIDWREILYSGDEIDCINIIDTDGTTVLARFEITDARLTVGYISETFAVNTTGFSGTENKTYEFWFGTYYGGATTRNKVFYVPDGNGNQLTVTFSELVISSTHTVDDDESWSNISYPPTVLAFANITSENLTPTTAQFNFNIEYFGTGGDGFVGETSNETIDIYYRINSGSWMSFQSNALALGSTYQSINKSWPSTAPSYGDSVEFKYVPDGVSP